MFRKLLVPVELGASSRAVAASAKQLAAPGAQIRLVHVLVNDTTLFYADLLDLPHITRAAQAELDQLAAHLGDGTEFEVETVVREGIVHKIVAEETKDFGPDLVVTGTHGRSMLGRLLLGSVVQRLIRDSVQPICVVKGEPKEGALSRIALATDFGSATRAAHDAFLDLAKQSGAKADVIHVFRSDHWLATGQAYAGLEGAAYPMSVTWEQVEERVRQRRVECTQELERISEKLRAEGVDVTTHLRDGEPWSEIEDLVQAEGIELVVLGSHHFKGFDRFVLGSIAEKTLRALECSVLLVPNPVEAD